MTAGQCLNFLAIVEVGQADRTFKNVGRRDRERHPERAELTTLSAKTAAR